MDEHADSSKWKGGSRMIRYAYCTGPGLYGPDELPIAMEDISSAGYSGIELNAHHVLSNDIRYIQELLEKFEIEMCSVLSGWLESDASVKKAEQVMMKTSELGVELISVLPPRRGKISWNSFMELLAKVLDLAQEREQTIALHHHGGCIVERPDEIRRVLSAEPRVKLLFDTSHYYPYGDVLKGIDELRDKIGYVHFNDVKVPEGFDEIIEEISNPPSNLDVLLNYISAFEDPGKGDIDLAAIFKKLSEFYDGWLSVEVINKRMTRSEHAKYNMEFIRSLSLAA